MLSSSVALQRLNLCKCTGTIKHICKDLSHCQPPTFLKTSPWSRRIINQPISFTLPQDTSYILDLRMESRLPHRVASRLYNSAKQTCFGSHPRVFLDGSGRKRTRIFVALMASLVPLDRPCAVESSLTRPQNTREQECAGFVPARSNSKCPVQATMPLLMHSCCVFSGHHRWQNHPPLTAAEERELLVYYTCLQYVSTGC